MTPAPNPARPPHASLWQSIRLACAKRTGKDCPYPFCKCGSADTAQSLHPKARAA